MIFFDCETTCHRPREGEDTMRRHEPVYLIAQTQCVDCQDKSLACACMTCAFSEAQANVHERVFDSFTPER
jgi:hypothetical protein